MMLPCDICGKSGHPWFDCALRDTKPAGWKPERLIPAPEAKLISGLVSGEGFTAADAMAAARSIIEDGEKRRPGRPKTGFDKKAYDRAKAAERRAAAREAKK